MAVKAPVRTLRFLMAERGIYRDTILAELAGVSISTISRIANHGTPPGEEVAAKLAAVLGCKADEIREAARLQREATS